MQRLIPFHGGSSELERKMTFGKCPRFHYKTHRRTRRKRLDSTPKWVGRRIFTAQSSETRFSTLALGSALFMGLQRSNTSGLVTDTSLGGYNQVDEQCILRELFGAITQTRFRARRYLSQRFRTLGIKNSISVKAAISILGPHPFPNKCLQEGKLPLFLESEHPWVKNSPQTI